MDLMDYRRKIIANSPHLMSVEGDIVSFSDGADLPLKSMIVDIDPVQSGTVDPSPSNVRPISGWDSVKLTRCGKNLLPLNIWSGFSYNKSAGQVFTPILSDKSWTQKTNSISYTTSSTYTALSLMTPLLPAGDYYISMWKVSSGRMRATKYVLDASMTVKEAQAASNVVNGWHQAVTLNSDGYIAFYIDNGSEASQTVELQFQITAGDTESAYEPYKSGLDMRISWNLFNTHLYKGIAYNPTVGDAVTLTDSEVQFTDNGNGVFSVATSATWKYFNVIIPIDAAKKYATKIAFSSTGQAGVTRGYLDADFKILTKFNSTDSAISWEYSLTPETDAAYYYFVFTNRGTASATLTLTQPQFVENTVVGDYEPYAGTVYGGTLNVPTGELVVDSRLLVLSSNGAGNYAYNSNNGQLRITGLKTMSNTLKNLCSHYKSFAGTFANLPDKSFMASGSTIAIKDTSYTSLQAWLAHLDAQVTAHTPVQARVKLSEATTIQLTPRQVRSLYGDNMILADAGNVALEYWAHP